MSHITTCKQVEHEHVFNHFAGRQEEGRFDRTNPDILTFINHVWNRNLGSVAALSHCGIGESVTNGFVQFITDDPIMQHDLSVFLTQVRDALPREDQPSIEIRSKTLPHEFKGDKVTHFMTVMMRSPRFKSRNEGNRWWERLATHVTKPAN